MRLAARNHGHVRSGFNLARELTTALVVAGWLFMAFQLMELTMRGTIASAGPGMGFFDQLKTWFLPQGFTLAALYSICTTQSLVWSGADFVKALGMWLAMVLAMMVPTLAAQFQNMNLPRLKLTSLLGFVGGYLFVWLGFCVAMVALQWGLRSNLVLSDHMVSSSAWLNAALLIAAGSYQLSQAKRHHLKACRLSLKRAFGGDGNSQTHNGINYAVHCIKCCWPLMLTMFVFGLMNIFAMAALTVLMVIEKSSDKAQGLVKMSGALLILIGVVQLLL